MVTEIVLLVAIEETSIPRCCHSQQELLINLRPLYKSVEVHPYNNVETHPTGYYSVF